MYIKLGESGAPCLMPLELLEVEVEVPFTKTEKEAIVTRPLISLSVFLQSSFYEAYREEIGKLLLKYLGLPLCIGLSKKKSSLWDSVMEQIEKKLSLWKGRYLSVGGCVVLIKSVLSSTSIYLFFLLPQMS